MGIFDSLFGRYDPYRASVKRAQDEAYARRGENNVSRYAAPPMRDSAIAPTIDAQMAQGRDNNPMFAGGPPDQETIMQMIMRNGGRPPVPINNAPEPGFSGATGAILTDALRAQGRSGLPPVQAAPSVPMLPPRPTPAGVPDQGIFSRLFSGQDFQSNNMPVMMQPQGPQAGSGTPMMESMNYGDGNNAADFFRMDQMLRKNNPGFFGL